MHNCEGGCETIILVIADLLTSRPNYITLDLFVAAGDGLKNGGMSSFQADKVYIPWPGYAFTGKLRPAPVVGVVYSISESCNNLACTYANN